MPDKDFLHRHPEFEALIRIVANRLGIDPYLAEEDEGVGAGEPRTQAGESIGDSDDNTLAETIDGLFKAALIHRRGPWRPFKAVGCATLEWVDQFNDRRLPESIGNMPPAEAGRNVHKTPEQHDRAA